MCLGLYRHVSRSVFLKLLDVLVMIHSFFTNALIAAILTGIVTGILGSYVVVRRMVFVSGGITHSSFAGLGFGFFMGQSPTLYALIAAVLSAWGVDSLSKSGQVREDSAIAAIWSLGMALGVLFTFLTPGYTPGLSSFLFGNLLLTTTTDLIFLALFAGITLLLVALLYRPLLYVSFDPEYATISGIRTRWFQLGMMIWVSIGIVLSIRAMGIMMLMSMLTLPQMTMNQWTRNFKGILIGSTLLSVVGLLLSLAVSYYINLPAGAVSVLLFSILFLVSKLVRKR